MCVCVVLGEILKVFKVSKSFQTYDQLSIFHFYNVVVCR